MEERFRKLNDRSKPIHISVIKYGLGFGRVQAVLGFRERFSDEVAQEAAEPAYTSHFLSCTQLSFLALASFNLHSVPGHCLTRLQYHITW